MNTELFCVNLYFQDNIPFLVRNHWWYFYLCISATEMSLPPSSLSLATSRNMNLFGQLHKNPISYLISCHDTDKRVCTTCGSLLPLEPSASLFCFQLSNDNRIPNVLFHSSSPPYKNSRREEWVLLTCKNQHQGWRFHWWASQEERPTSVVCIVFFYHARLLEAMWIALYSI